MKNLIQHEKITQSYVLFLMLFFTYIIVSLYNKKRTLKRFLFMTYPRIELGFPP